MPAKSEKGVLSVFAWVLTLIVLALPCIGFVMTIIWAIWDRDPSRRNFCRATIVIWLFIFALYLALIALGFGPELASKIREALNPK